MAVGALVDDFYNHQGALAQDVMTLEGVRDQKASAKPKSGAKGKKANGKGMSADQAIDTWTTSRTDTVARTESLLADIKATGTVDLAMLAVANGQLRTLLAR